jgi:hypothetical protein
MPLSDSLAARITVGDLAAISRPPRARVAQLGRAGHHLEHRPEVVQLGRRGGGRGVDHRPHLVLGHQAGEVGGGAERAPVDLGQPEGGVVAGDDDVGVADEPMPPPGRTRAPRR